MIYQSRFRVMKLPLISLAGDVKSNTISIVTDESNTNTCELFNQCRCIKLQQNTNKNNVHTHTQCHTRINTQQQTKEDKDKYILYLDT